MKRISVIHPIIALALALLLATTASAVIVCHDYTLYRLTGKDPRSVSSAEKDGTGIAALRKHLTDNKYKRFPYTNAVQNREKAQRFLKPGDVIIIRDDHSGYVNEQGLIDHFIQVYGTSRSAVKYDAKKLPLNSSLGGKVGGLYQNESLDDFLNRPFRKTPMIVEVWRKG